MWYSFSRGNLGLFKSLKTVPTLIHLTVHLKELSKEIELWTKTFLQGVHLLNVIIQKKITNKKKRIHKLYWHVLEGYIMIGEMHVKKMGYKIVLCYQFC